MFNRKKMNRKTDKKVFARTATGAHKKNFRTNPKRGGYRI